MKDGAFRPPVIRQEQTMPLSRQPRAWTTAMTQPGFADYSKKARVCGTAKDFREVHNETLQACVHPTATFNLQKPVQQTYEVKHVIQPVISNDVFSGVRSMDWTTQHVQEPTKEVLDMALHAFAQSNASQNKYVNNSSLSTEPFIQNHLLAEAYTNPSQNINVTSLDEMADMPDRGVRDIQTTSYNAPVSGPEQNKLNHAPIVLERALPQHSYHTNAAKSSVHKTIAHTNELSYDRNTPLTSMQVNPSARGFHEDSNSRAAHLNQKISPGGFDPRASMPLMERANGVPQLGDARKNHLAKHAADHFGNRFE
jgi:hypothetical protein